jgi:hypothetical protein
MVLMIQNCSVNARPPEPIWDRVEVGRYFETRARTVSRVRASWQWIEVWRETRAVTSSGDRARLTASGLHNSFLYDKTYDYSSHDRRSLCVQSVHRDD